MVRRYEPEEPGRGIRPLYWLSVLLIILAWAVAYKMYISRYENLHPDVTWATPGIDRRTERADGVLLWDEMLLTAPVSGTVSYPQGTGPVRVAKGAAVARVSDGGLVREVKAPQQGYFVAGTDGHENEWRYSYLWPGSDPLPAAGHITMMRDGQSIQAGGPVGKIVQQPQTLRFIGYIRASKITLEQMKNKTLHVMMDNEDTVSNAEVSVSVAFSDKIKFLMNIPWFREDNVLTRKYSLIIETDRVEGAMIPETAVAVKDGVEGVYLVRGTRVVFRPVTGKAVRNGKFIVTKGIFTGDGVVEDASNAKEGRIQLW